MRYGRAASAAQAASAQADFEYARQSIAALVAKSWFLATEAGLQAEAARETIRASEELVRLADDRARVGVGNEEDVFVARASVGDLSRRPAPARARTRAGDSRARAPARPLPVGRGGHRRRSCRVSPARSRPGCRRSCSSGGRTSSPPSGAWRPRSTGFGEAKAARLPAIALTTGVSAISSELFVLKDHDNPVWNLGANLLAPIFRGGALKTQVEIRTAEQKQAIAEYAAVGLRAFGEVESALAAEIAAREREQILAQTLSDNQQALDVVQTQFKVGSTDLRFVEQRQLALNATRSALIRVQAEQRVQRVNLHLALGGSFELRPPPPTTPPGGVPPSR